MVLLQCLHWEKCHYFWCCWCYCRGKKEIPHAWNREVWCDSCKYLSKSRLKRWTAPLITLISPESTRPWVTLMVWERLSLLVPMDPENNVSVLTKFDWRHMPCAGQNPVFMLNLPIWILIIKDRVYFETLFSEALGNGRKREQICRIKCDVCCCFSQLQEGGKNQK